ncbi:MAG: hypothetical protein V1763_02370 [Parcubacteria group bacterium]
MKREKRNLVAILFAVMVVLAFFAVCMCQRVKAPASSEDATISATIQNIADLQRDRNVLQRKLLAIENASGGNFADDRSSLTLRLNQMEADIKRDMAALPDGVRKHAIGNGFISP